MQCRRVLLTNFPTLSVPAIEDPNTGITLWESGAVRALPASQAKRNMTNCYGSKIIEYLIERYDPSAKLSYTSSPEKYYCKQFLYFQVSGQGPYFGQAVWYIAPC